MLEFDDEIETVRRGIIIADISFENVIIGLEGDPTES